jgi:hypothetical protein
MKKLTFDFRQERKSGIVVGINTFIENQKVHKR